jgi:radical SAM protein with 4Fe4S-binding SPASM domain
MNPKEKTYRLVPVMFRDGEYKPTQAVCMDCRKMINVRSNGEVITCLQIGGGLDAMGEHFESLHEKPLAEILKDSLWERMVCTNVHRISEVTPECKNCRFFKYCGGGCRLECETIYSKDTAVCKSFELFEEQIVPILRENGIVLVTE